ncbi:MAG: hypothetical protein JRI23_11105 [Deltaproteobacteria bacterium]|nr:hypothetical protein [Deltaproteobacteria bacterium]MBW2532230.1 hypothetical protein [Deltaproteobacteria bacterium]
MSHDPANRPGPADAEAATATEEHDRSEPDPAAPASGVEPTEATEKAAGRWSRFFEFDDLPDQAIDEHWADGRIVHIEYGDFECLASHLHPDPHKWSFYNVPITPLPSRAARARPLPTSAIFVELDDGDVALESDERMKSVVRTAAERAEHALLLRLNHQGAPVALGDDREHFAERCEEAWGRPVVANTRKAKDEGSLLARTLRLIRDRDGFDAQPTDSSKVNLFGFPKRFRDEELAPLLSRLGLTINAAIAPEIEVKAIERIPQAGLNVVCMPTNPGRDVLAELRRLPRPWVEVALPYGPRATRRCFEQIIEAAAGEADIAAIWRERWDPLDDRWEDLLDRSDGKRLAFVVTEENSHALTNLSRLGLPIVSLVAELGFGVDVLCEAGHIHQLERDLAALPGTLDASVLPFANRDELEALLCHGESRAVYSDFGLDRRISRAGKGHFSRRNFEMGLYGALRTLESLVAVCELPFYARYGRHLMPRAKRGQHD